MIPALRLVPPGHTLVTLGERFFGGLTLYYDRAPRGARRVGGRLHLSVVDDNSSSLDEKKRLTQRQEIISVSSQVHQL